MHEKGSTPRPADGGWLFEIKQVYIRRKFFFVWLLLFIAITGYCIYKDGTIFGEAGILHLIVVYTITFPTLFFILFIEAICFFTLSQVFFIDVPRPLVDYIIIIISYVLAGYLQWGYFVPKLVVSFRGKKSSPMMRIDNILMLVVPLIIAALLFLMFIIFGIFGIIQG